jgi:hypothetical protein
MLKLQRDTHATQVHGTTDQEIVDCTLPKDTEYTLECVVPAWNAAANRGQDRALILVGGCYYRVWSDAL